MKIALSLAGYFNSQRDTSSLGLDGFEYLKKILLDHYNVDVYLHSWDLQNKETILKLYDPYLKDYIIENQIDFQPVYKNNKLDLYPHREGVTKFWNVLSQLYSVQKSMSLVKENNYDVVIKARFDTGRINLSTLNQSSYAVQFINFNPELDMDKFYMAKWSDYTLESEGPADVWFYSSYKNMKQLCYAYDIAEKDFTYSSEYANWCGSHDGGPINTAKAWKWILIKLGLWHKKICLESVWN